MITNGLEDTYPLIILQKTESISPKTTIVSLELLNDTEYLKAQNFLINWNLSTTFDNKHAAFGVCILAPEWLAEIKKEMEPDPIKIFKDCVDEFNENFGWC